MRTIQPKTTEIPEAKSNGTENRARKAIVSSRHVIHIQDDVGGCWRAVGATLRVPTPALCNIDVDKTDSSQDKAWEVLNKWKQQEGENATVGSLVGAFEEIKRKDIGQKLLEFAVKKVQELEENRKLQKEKEEMKTEISNARRSSAELLEEVCLVTGCLEKEQQTQKKTLKKLEEVKKSLHEFELLMAKDENDKDVMETRVQQLKTTVKGLEEKLSTEKSEKESYVKEVANLRKLYDQMDHDLRILKEKFEKITEGDRESDQTRPDYNENVLNETPNHRGMLERNQGCSRCHDLEKELSTLKKTQMESVQNNIKHTEKKSTLETEKDDNETKVTDSKKASARQTDLDSQQGVQIEDFIKAINEDPKLLKKKIEELERTAESTKKQYDNKIDESNKEIKQLKKENKMLKAENTKIKTKGNETIKFEKVRKERDQLSSKMEQLDKQLSDSQFKRGELEEENVKYGNQCLAYKKKLDAFKTKIETDQNKIKQLELKQETLEKEKKDRDAKFTELMEDYTKLFTFHPIRVRQLEQIIADLIKEKEDVKLQLRSEKKKMKRELTNNNEDRKRPEKAAREDEDSIQAIEKLKLILKFRNTPG
ncbi:hypothetical protein ACROYT_G025801 [Oculina patagonica]